MNVPSLPPIIGYVRLMGFPLLLIVQGCVSRETRNDSERPGSARPPISSAKPPVPKPAPDQQDTVNTFPTSASPQPKPNWHTIQKPTSATDGKVVFDWPSRMKLDETYLIHLTIACNVPLLYLQQQVDSLAVVDADTAGQHRRRRSKMHVTLSRRMKASLMGASASDSNVTIARPPDDDGNRTIDLQTDTSVVWSWNVTPHKAGPMKLTMYLTRVAERDSRPVDVQTIFVEGIPPTLFDRATALLTKLNGLWLLLSTGAGGALIALIRYLWNRRVPGKPASAAPPKQDA